MKGDLTWEQFLDLMCEDPEFAARWREDEHRLDLAMNIYWLREERGMTQRQLAEAVGVKQPRIAEIEHGDANPTLTTIIRIAHALEVRPERLFADRTLPRPVDASPQADDVVAPGADADPPKRSGPGKKPAPAKRSRPARAGKT